MPMAWRNHAAGVGYDLVGDSMTDGTKVGDAALGLEYHFQLPVGSTQVVELERRFGTVSRPCRVSLGCGDGTVAAGRGMRLGGSGQCHRATGVRASLPRAVMAIRTWRRTRSATRIGINTNACNGDTCRFSACGDGYPNQAAGEACDDGPDDSVNCMAGAPPESRAAAMATSTGRPVNSASPAILCNPDQCVHTFTLGGGCGGRGAGDAAGAPWLMVVALWLLRRRLGCNVRRQQLRG